MSETSKEERNTRLSLIVIGLQAQLGIKTTANAAEGMRAVIEGEAGRMIKRIAELEAEVARLTAIEAEVERLTAIEAAAKRFVDLRNEWSKEAPDEMRLPMPLDYAGSALGAAIYPVGETK